MTKLMSMKATSAIAFRRRDLSFSKQSRHDRVSATRIGLVGSQPVLWKIQRRRPHSVTRHDLLSALKVQVPPVAIPVQSGCSQTGNLKLVPRLRVAEFVLTTLSGPSEKGLYST